MFGKLRNTLFLIELNDRRIATRFYDKRRGHNRKIEFGWNS